MDQSYNNLADNENPIGLISIEIFLLSDRFNKILNHAQRSAIEESI